MTDVAGAGPMRPIPAWAVALVLSAFVHVAAAVIYLPAYAPEEPQAQAPPETRLDMETVEAPRQDAAARDPEGEAVAEGEARSTALDAGAVPHSRARPIAAPIERQAAATPAAQSASSADPVGMPIQSAPPHASRIAGARPGAQALAPAAPTAQPAPEAPAPAPQPALSAEVAAMPLAANPAEAAIAQPIAPQIAYISSAEAAGETAPLSAPTTEALAALAPSPGPAMATEEFRASRLIAATPGTEDARPAPAPTTSLAAARPEPHIASAAAPVAAQVAGAAPVITPATSLTPETTAGALVSVPADRAAPVTASSGPLPAVPAAGQQTVASPLDGPTLPPAAPEAVSAEKAEPSATSARAALAWQFGDRVVTDAQALATIQAFMEPSALDDAQAVKDDLSAVLTGVDCARLSATFIPETGTLEMRGHVPDPELQGPILAALRAQVGEGIPVTANLLHLPAPQCGALTGIADVGLPQSTDQFTDARLIGATAHAREYSYTEGQRLKFDLTAPDYDAFVYVDYFNADGEVIHLVPNETIPLEKHDAKSVFGVGTDRPGRPGLRITIGPPYGQEIAVAFASSHRLYDGLRPTVEPAAPYLEELQTLVAEARARHPDFRGEWVYFFITTSPATQ